jgi:hypothetical protein
MDPTALILSALGSWLFDVSSIGALVLGIYYGKRLAYYLDLRASGGYAD